MNTSGGRVVEVLDCHETMYRSIWAKLLPGELPDFDRFVDEGRIYRDELVEIVHGARDPRDFDRAGMRSWLRHGWKTDALVKRIVAETGAQ
jgi:hypothetical protein